MRRLACPLLVAGVLAAAGCGGDDGGDDEERVRTVATQYVSALAAGNGQRACGHLTEEAQKAVVELVTAAFADPPDLTCEEAVGDISGDLEGDRKQAMLNPKLGEMKIEGDRADVTVKGVPGGLVLARSGESWKVSRSDLPG